jgi:hypothetical protein
MKTDVLKTNHPRNLAGRRVYLRTFEGWHEFIALASGVPSHPHAAGAHHEHGVKSHYLNSQVKWGGGRWFGEGQSFDDAKKLALQGWENGRKLLDQYSTAIRQHVCSKIVRPVPLWDVTGDFVDIGCFMSGVPECMVRTEEEEAPAGFGRIVRVSLNTGASSNVSPEAMMGRGAAVLALVDALELAGRRCEVWLHTCHEGSAGEKSQLEMKVPLKAAGDPVDLETLAFALAHPATNRRFRFANVENDPDEAIVKWYGTNASYGHPHAPMSEEYDISAPGMLCTTDSETILKWVFTELLRQGVELTLKEESSKAAA